MSPSLLDRIRSLGSAAVSRVAPGDRINEYLKLLAWEAWAVPTRGGLDRLSRYRLAQQYYVSENFRATDAQYADPLGVNYLSVVADNYASYVWGQWETQGSIVSWNVRPRRGKTPLDSTTSNAILDWAYDLFEGHEELLMTSSLNQSMYGDAILVPRWDNLYERVYPEGILPEFFHARWSPHNVEHLTEVIIAYYMARGDAQREFGVSGDMTLSFNPTFGKTEDPWSSSHGVYWQRYTVDDIQTWFDNYLIEDLSGPNPFADVANSLPGVIPFVHIPNMRAGGEFYGFGDLERAYKLQDEINRKLEDQSDTIAYSAHPIVLLKKYFGHIDDLPVGPDAIWNLGREGEAMYLSGSPPPVDSQAHLDRVIKIFQDVTALPGVAYGRGEAVRASAMAMAMDMLPVTSKITWKRLAFKKGLARYALMAARLAEINGALPFKRVLLQDYVLEPAFSPVLPKDQSSEVQEAVQLTTNFIRSRRRTLEKLGEKDIDTELSEINKDMQAMAALGIQMNVGGKNKRGPGGTSGDSKSS